MQDRKHQFDMLINPSLKDVNMESCNPVSTPGPRLTEKVWADAEHLPSVVAGLYMQETGRPHNVAGQRPDTQQAVKELTRGMSHWAR